MSKMDWREEVLAGMELISKGCADNGEWGLCNDCPFTAFCDFLYYGNDGATPTELFARTLEKGLDND